MVSKTHNNMSIKCCKKFKIEKILILKIADLNILELTEKTIVRIRMDKERELESKIGFDNRSKSKIRLGIDCNIGSIILDTGVKLGSDGFGVSVAGFGFDFGKEGQMKTPFGNWKL